MKKTLNSFDIKLTFYSIDIAGFPKKVHNQYRENFSSHIIKLVLFKIILTARKLFYMSTISLGNLVHMSYYLLGKKP